MAHLGWRNRRWCNLFAAAIELYGEPQPPNPDRQNRKGFSVKTIFATLSCLTLAVCVSSAAYAFNAETFTKEKFESAQKSEKIVLVDVAAKWCPTCKQQSADMKALFSSDKKYNDIVFYTIDYDKKDDVRNFQKIVGRPVPRQSTIVIYKGSKLVAFSVAETGDALKKQIEKAFL